MNKDLLNFCVDASRGVYPNGVTRKQADDIIRAELLEITKTATPTPRQMRKYSDEIFSILEVALDQRISEGWENNPFFQQFVEYRDLSLGDKNEFYVEDKTMLVVSELADGHWNLHRQKLDIGDSFSVEVATYGVKVYTDFLRYLSGRIDFVQLVAKVEEAMKFKIATELYINFMATMDYLPTEFKHTGSISEDEILDIIDHVRASNNFAPVVIAGSRKALKALTGTYNGANSYLVSERMKDQRNMYGEFELWEGHQLLEIPQVHTPNTFDFMLNDNRLMILPANVKPIKFVREGNSMIHENIDPTRNMDMSIEYTFLTRFGISCIFNRYYGMYEIVR